MQARLASAVMLPRVRIKVPVRPLAAVEFQTILLAQNSTSEGVMAGDASMGEAEHTARDLAERSACDGPAGLEGDCRPAPACLPLATRAATAAAGTGSTSRSRATVPTPGTRHRACADHRLSASGRRFADRPMRHPAPRAPGGVSAPVLHVARGRVRSDEACCMAVVLAKASGNVLFPPILTSASDDCVFAGTPWFLGRTYQVTAAQHAHSARK